MCDKCSRAYWKYQDEYNQSMRDGVQGFSPTEKQAKRAYREAVRNCEGEKEPIVVRDYWNK